MNNVGAAIMLTTLAGLSTGIGGLVAFFSKKTNTKFLAFTLGISAGVMIYVSFMELLVKAIGTLGIIYGDKPGTIRATIAFFGGILVAALIDRFVPEGNSADTLKNSSAQKGKSGLFRTGLVTAVVMGVHNFPEGMATFVSALQSPVMALPIVAAIAIHNIPEGVAVSVPIFYATGNRQKAFLYSLVSGLAEPIGAIIGYLVLMPFINESLNAVIFAAVAGIMVFISVNEILPSAREYSDSYISVSGLVLGMLVMAVSLIGFM
ncbi:MAG: zinc transporter ZupT [Clostridia bacterium]|nr:zinc transporter ZupT [Clostridia bacterium]